MKPRIAVLSHTGVNINNFFSHVQPVTYTEAVEEGGGLPYLLPFTRQLELLEEMLEPMQGILLTGGLDISPIRYGARQGRECKETSDELDAYQFAAFEAGLKLGLPMLGICRGHQLMNVALGGTLYQDIDVALNDTTNTSLKKHWDADPMVENLHPVQIEPDSRLAGLLGCEVVSNSHHHQAVKELGEGLRVVATSGDGVIEGLEHIERPLLSVQWHPEIMMTGSHEKAMLPLFRWLVEESGR